MAEIGIIGAGKLGTPVALAIESRGHNVQVYDVNPAVEGYFNGEPYPHQEEHVPEMLTESRITVAKTVGELVAGKDIVFTAIQTPHEPRFEGTTRLPEDRADFDYTWLKKAVSDVSRLSRDLGKRTTLAVISTCLPGTFEREIRPLLTDNVAYVYTPQFIAMGGVVDDYLNPEFNLIGVEDEAAADQLERFYATINDAPNVRTDITTAEGIKVSYNTWITAKTVIANAWGEMCERLGMNFDDMYEAWSLSNQRLISPRYMEAGESDGGGCHPRDNIALSWLADEVGMSHNLWEDLMEARERYEEWHVDLAVEAAKEAELPIVLLGRSFKPETKIEVGSPAILMANLLKEKEIPYQHYEDLEGIPQKAVYFIATKHERYKDIRFPKGSVVLDPFGYLEPQYGVIISHIGRNPKNGRKQNSPNIKTEHTSNS